MRIVCPDCSATYEVPERLAASGKRLRCARCAHEWVPPEMAAAAAVPPSPPAHPAPAAPPPPSVVIPSPAEAPPALHADPKPKVSAPTRSGARRAVALALAASLAILAGILAAGVVWRAAMMRAFPPSELLYRYLGLG